MKVRGLSAIVTTIVLAVILLLGSRYLKSSKINHSYDTRSRLTTKQTEKILAKPTPRIGLKSLISQNLEKQDQMIENKEFIDESLLTRELTYTEIEINEMTQTQFVDLLKATELKLPSIADIGKLPAAAVHHTPALIMQAGRDLGFLKEVLKVHESYEKEAAIFYEKCAQTNERPKTIKALCLTNLIEIKKKNNEVINLNKYPKDIVGLSKLIIDI